uniref:DUF6570 domain-containing protein n=1 Tax=Chromera velia CCMP2878 TaxID=1169474 RepID=A0A0G4I9M4_9ALVE|eukprot:Cvel_2031.t1-p1 / transcript=Cvel_2031.t1 / gene=Cvel_2031 / organism=Chromera_velia_CCMP2878 / gene_product=hypothetical protein / transcript_product=hypothetical protein / location=Cvel_scaffold78:10306-11308(+) / protein_length=256 / sequence_SO=supercontig / SO=protein_coding / is_pseudo=false
MTEAYGPLLPIPEVWTPDWTTDLGIVDAALIAKVRIVVWIFKVTPAGIEVSRQSALPGHQHICGGMMFFPQDVNAIQAYLEARERILPHRLNTLKGSMRVLYRGKKTDLASQLKHSITAHPQLILQAIRWKCKYDHRYIAEGWTVDEETVKEIEAEILKAQAKDSHWAIDFSLVEINEEDEEDEFAPLPKKQSAKPTHAAAASARAPPSDPPASASSPAEAPPVRVSATFLSEAADSSQPAASPPDEDDESPVIIH